MPAGFDSVRQAFSAPDGKEADLSKPVQVYILLGQSNMVGLGKIASLEDAVKTKKKYLYLAGFFFWQGEKDCGSAADSERYEKNLVRFIKRLRIDFDSPSAKFVLATLGEAKKGEGGNKGKVTDAQLAVDGKGGKYPEFKGNVATVYANPLSKGGSGNSHYGGNAETYMDVGEVMGRAMVGLLAQ